jgi:integrase
VKNEVDLDFEIPSHIATMLLEYRDNIAPKIIGHRPKQVFVNRDGKLKNSNGLATLITRCLKRRVGIDFHVHAFRHLAGELILRKFPGGHGLVKDLLGHRSITTTLNNYVSIRTRQAGQHHQFLLEETLAKASIPSRPTIKHGLTGARS